MKFVPLNPEFLDFAVKLAVGNGILGEREVWGGKKPRPIISTIEGYWKHQTSDTDLTSKKIFLYDHSCIVPHSQA